MVLILMPTALHQLQEMRLDELFHKIHQSTEEGLEKLKAMADHEAILKRKTDLKVSA